MAGNKDSGRRPLPLDQQMKRHPAQIYMKSEMYQKVKAIADEEHERVIARALRQLVREALRARGMA